MGRLRSWMWREVNFQYSTAFIGTHNALPPARQCQLCNRAMRGRVIADLANFRRPILRGPQTSGRLSGIRG